MNIILLILIILLVAGLPSWPYAQNWGYGYYPSGAIGLILVILFIVMLLGRHGPL